MVLYIKNLRLKVILGVDELERMAEQEVVVSIRLEYDATEAVRTDALRDAVNYKEVRERIIAVATEAKSRLVESLAHRIAQELRGDPRLLAVEVEVEKPGALRLADSVSATVSWKNDSGSAPLAGESDGNEPVIRR